MKKLSKLPPGCRTEANKYIKERLHLPPKDYANDQDSALELLEHLHNHMSLDWEVACSGTYRVALTDRTTNIIKADVEDHTLPGAVCGAVLKAFGWVLTSI